MEPNQPRPRRFRYRISSALLLIVLAALLLTGWVYWRRSQVPIARTTGTRISLPRSARPPRRPQSEYELPLSQETPTSFIPQMRFPALTGLELFHPAPDPGAIDHQAIGRLAMPVNEPGRWFMWQVEVYRKDGKTPVWPKLYQDSAIEAPSSKKPWSPRSTT
jgi:hypothetical protein